MIMIANNCIIVIQFTYKYYTPVRQLKFGKHGKYVDVQIVQGVA